MKRASTSLPVPDSPTISTVQSLAATRRASSARRCDAAAYATSSHVARLPLAALSGAGVKSSLIQTSALAWVSTRRASARLVPRTIGAENVRRLTGWRPPRRRARQTSVATSLPIIPSFRSFSRRAARLFGLEQPLCGAFIQKFRLRPVEEAANGKVLARQSGRLQHTAVTDD